MGRIKRGEGDGLYCLHYTSQLSLQAHLVLEEAVLECMRRLRYIGNTNGMVSNDINLT